MQYKNEVKDLLEIISNNNLKIEYLIKNSCWDVEEREQSNAFGEIALDLCERNSNLIKKCHELCV